VALAMGAGVMVSGCAGGGSGDGSPKSQIKFSFIGPETLQVAVSDRLPNPTQDIIETYRLIYITGDTSIFGDTILLSMEGQVGGNYNDATINSAHAAYVYINPSGISDSLEVHFYCDMRGGSFYHWHPGTYFRLRGQTDTFEIVTDTILLRKRLWMEVDTLPGRKLSVGTIRATNRVLNGYAADSAFIPGYHPTYTFIKPDTPYVIMDDCLPFLDSIFHEKAFYYWWDRGYRDLDTVQYPFWIMTVDTYDWKAAGYTDTLERYILGLVAFPDDTFSRKKLMFLFNDRIEQLCNQQGVNRDWGKGAVFAHELGHYMAHMVKGDNHDDSLCIMMADIVPITIRELVKRNFCPQCLIRIQIRMPRGSEVFKGGSFQREQEVTR